MAFRFSAAALDQAGVPAISGRSTMGFAGGFAGTIADNTFDDESAANRFWAEVGRQDGLQVVCAAIAAELGRSNLLSPDINRRIFVEQVLSPGRSLRDSEATRSRPETQGWE
jgi:hypothetical protein